MHLNSLAALTHDFHGSEQNIFVILQHSLELLGMAHLFTLVNTYTHLKPTHTYMPPQMNFYTFYALYFIHLLAKLLIP